MEVIWGISVKIMREETTMSAIETVGVIGLGNMGGGMAASLARAKFKVLGLDMDPDKSVAGVR